MPRRTDKRQRLIEAAKELIHQQGFNLTTLADIALKADVPLGNVYYYFKTKEAIGEAVIEKLSAIYAEVHSKWDEHANPADRLREFIKSGTSNLESIARHGCPLGGLCQELGKQGGSLADQAAKMLHDLLEWSTEQFKSLGFTADKARNNALDLTSGIQGMYLLTHTFKDPQLSEQQIYRLIAWLDAKVAEVGAAPATISVASRVVEEESVEEMY
jgi:TetR/AcrR family transcriptional regulator, transcriptional repressor for nem operon